MKRITITLADELDELVDGEARRRQTSVSEVIRGCITTSLTGSAEQPRKIPWAGLFHDPESPPAERLDEALAESWADDLHRDRG